MDSFPGTWTSTWWSTVPTGVRWRHVLGNTPGFTLWTQRSGVWRFYLSHLPKVESPSKWPFVEIYFFSEDDEHLWGLTNSLKYLMVDRECVLSLSTSRWEHLNVSVPACTERMVKNRV
ncbi:hypothetical protein BaRGS_00016341 [Batillaria attramentaria]|uniref:Uncharacterized protein n=1 Tax=Batillaria attramentaria TaxID=370345 RepID=A0ABD0KZV7_9CAEN